MRLFKALQYSTARPEGRRASPADEEVQFLHALVQHLTPKRRDQRTYHLLGVKISS